MGLRGQEEGIQARAQICQTQGLGASGMTERHHNCNSFLVHIGGTCRKVQRGDVACPRPARLGNG